MPEFVGSDAGFSVPFLDTDSAANALEILIANEDNCRRQGLTARKKLLQRHSDDIAVPEIYRFCREVAALPPAVSVIVPNYNCEKYLKKRIDSILNQSFRDFEIIILDDASTDNSLQIIE